MKHQRNVEMKIMIMKFSLHVVVNQTKFIITSNTHRLVESVTKWSIKENVERQKRSKLHAV